MDGLQKQVDNLREDFINHQFVDRELWKNHIDLHAKTEDKRLERKHFLLGVIGLGGVQIVVTVFSFIL